MGGAIGAIAQVAMPMVSNLLSGGLSGMLGKLGNFGDMFKNLFGGAQGAAQGAADKIGGSFKAADEARQKAEGFVNNPGQGAPRPAFNINLHVA
jgi:phage-related protein